MEPQKQLIICKEVDLFLKTYSRQVIQLKTLKAKMEESTNTKSIFKQQTLTIQQIKDAILSCDMGRFLDDKTITNYHKLNQQCTFEALVFPNTAQQKQQPELKTKPNKQQKIQQQHSQSGFEKYLQDFSIHILQNDQQELPEINLCQSDQLCQFEIVFEQYCSIFEDDKYILQQRLLTDLENIQMYLKPIMINNPPQKIIEFIPQQSGFTSDNIPFLIVMNGIDIVRQNKQEIDSDTLDMNYPYFSQQIQKILLEIKHQFLGDKNDQIQDWQMQIMNTFEDLILCRN